MKKQVAFVLSTNYAGSHFLALQMGSHTRCASIGELHHFRKEKTSRRACHRCETDEQCPYYKGVLKSPVEDFYSGIFGNLADVDPRVETLIDNSKKPRWPELFLDSQDFSMKCVHLIRDPRALVRRAILNNKTRSKKATARWQTVRRCWRHGLGILTGNEVNVYSWKWLCENREISDFLRRNRVDFKVVTYHDLVFTPDEVLTELMQWLGYEFEPEQKAYWNFKHHSSVKKDYLKPPPDGEKIFDQRWKSFLDAESQEQIYTHPHVRSYLEELGLTFDLENGLSRQ